MINFKNQKSNVVLIGIILFLSFSSRAFASVVNATSANLVDVQTAINSAASGDIVVVPAGNVTWNGSILINNKSIHLVGAGIDVTTINSASGVFITMVTNDCSVSGITFVDSNPSTSGVILFMKGLRFVIGHCKFIGTQTKVDGVYCGGGTDLPHPTGVVHHCQFIDARFYVQGDLATSINHQFGRRIWADLDAKAYPGTPDTIFIEDCDLKLTRVVGENLFDAQYGGHYVVRHSTITDGSIHSHGLNDSTERGTRFVECYDNLIQQVNLHKDDPPFWLRGGTGVVFNNTIKGTWSTMALALDLIRSTNGVGNGSDPMDGNYPAPNGTGSHNGAVGSASLTDSSKNWTPNEFVGFTVYNLTDGSLGSVTANSANTITATLAHGTRNNWNAGDSYKVTNGYPLRDQPGTSTDAYFWSGDPVVAPPPQKLDPVYEWNNTLNGANVNWLLVNGGAAHMKLGRDYFNDTVKPGYTPYTYPHPLAKDPVLDPSNGIIPTDRRIDWSKNAGLGFQIPTWPNGKNAKTDYGAVGDGTHDDTNAIQSCLNNTPLNSFCFLPAGTYRVTKSLVLTDGTGGTGFGSKGLRGAGADVTTIKADGGIGSILTTVDYGFSQWINVTSGGAVKDSSRISVDGVNANLLQYQPGDLIMLDQDNGPDTENSPAYMDHTLGQLNVVKAVGSNYIDVKTPLTHTYDATLNPRVSRCSTYLKNIGVENLSLDRVTASAGGGNNIDLIRCVNSWVRGVHSMNAPNWHVNVTNSYGTIVRDSRFEQTWQFNCGGNACYGVQLFGKTSDSLVENNIFKLLRHSMIIENGGTDNLFGYNYSRDPINENQLQTDYLMGDMATHGGDPYMNLWEGNTAATISNDNALGSSRTNTYLRNNVEVKSIPTVYVAMFGIDDQIGNLYENYVGNMLGSSGKMKSVYRLGTWQDQATGTAYDGITLPDARVQQTMISHGNYNYLTASYIWDSTIPNHTIPNSLYYAAQPNWWPASVAWPPIGPGVANPTNEIPAQICYDKGQMPNCQSAAAHTHPADTNNDFVMSQQEATKFISCWKSQPAIPTGCPASSTLNDAVRAGTLWKSSSLGTYEYDSLSPCPLCWSPIP